MKDGKSVKDGKREGGSVMRTLRDTYGPVMRAFKHDGYFGEPVLTLAQIQSTKAAAESIGDVRMAALADAALVDARPARREPLVKEHGHYLIGRDDSGPTAELYALLGRILALPVSQNPDPYTVASQADEGVKS